MPIDPDQPAVVMEALQAADTVDATAIEVVADGDVVVLRGSVATFEEASAAQNVAEAHAADVRNELRVDVNLREGLDFTERGPDRQVADSVSMSSFNPVEQPDDLVSDMQHSLEENLPWDPPTESVEVPTRAEARGAADRSGADDFEDGTLLDEAGAGTKSLPDMSAEELSRAAHPQPRDEETT